MHHLVERPSEKVTVNDNCHISSRPSITVFFYYPNWVIPENIHTLPRAASSSRPPLALGNSKMLNPPLPSEFQTVLPPHAFGIP